MTELWRLTGAGNDFLALVEPEQPPPAERIRAWCRRGSSLGADGLFVLQRRSGGVAMEYFNADGGAAALCLNGTRCAARLAFELGWADEVVTVETGAGSIACRRTGPETVATEVPTLPDAPRRVELEAAGQRLTAWAVRLGVPHLVLRWTGPLAECPVERLGPPLRSHPAVAPEGANVDFVRRPAVGELELRTWERGVEAETLACGTGVLAAVAVEVAEGGLELPVRVRTRGGFELTVRGELAERRIRRWSLAGDARLLAREQVFPGAAALP